MTPHVTKYPLCYIDPLHYERPPTLQKTPYIVKYGTFRSDLHFEMMYIKKQKTFRNSQVDILKRWRYRGIVTQDVSGMGCIALGSFITWGIVILRTWVTSIKVCLLPYFKGSILPMALILRFNNNKIGWAEIHNNRLSSEKNLNTEPKSKAGHGLYGLWKGTQG